MSAVFNVLREDYALIATDTRIMLLDNSEREYADEFQKIYKAKDGWVSGTGVGEIIRAVAESAERDFYAVYEKVSRSFLTKYREEDIRNTIVCMSYMNGHGIPGLLYMGSDYGCANIEINSFVALQPNQIDDAAWGNICVQFEKQLEFGQQHSLNKDVRTVAEAIFQVSEICGAVSPVCDIGILTSNGQLKRIRNDCKRLLEWEK